MDDWTRCGLRLGTSYSGFGAERISEIVPIEHSVLRQREAEIDQFLARQVREIHGHRVKYSVFSLI